MKISVEVDCTPEEARRCAGLPDLTPLHDAYLDRARAAIDQGLTPEVIRSMVQTWGPMGEAGVTLWRQMIEQMTPGSR